MGWKRQFYASPYSFTPPLCGRPVSQASRLTSPTSSPGRALDPPLGVEPATPLLCAGTGPTAAACLAPPALRGALGKVAAGPLRAWVTAAGSSYGWALRVLKVALDPFTELAAGTVRALNKAAGALGLVGKLSLCSLMGIGQWWALNGETDDSSAALMGLKLHGRILWSINRYKTTAWGHRDNPPADYCCHIPCYSKQWIISIMISYVRTISSLTFGLTNYYQIVVTKSKQISFNI